MSKLLEQVAELQRKAHVCPSCARFDGEYAGWVCPDCHGTGQVEAPDIDALCQVIEVLAEAVEDTNEWVSDEDGTWCPCCGAEKWDRNGEHNQDCALSAAFALLDNGIQPISIPTDEA